MGGRTREEDGLDGHEGLDEGQMNSLKSLEWRFLDQNRWRFYGSSGMTARAVGAALTHTHSWCWSWFYSHVFHQKTVVWCWLCNVWRLNQPQSLNLISHLHIRQRALIEGPNSAQFTLIVEFAVFKVGSGLFYMGCKRRSATQNYVAIMLTRVVQHPSRLQHKVIIVAELILTKNQKNHFCVVDMF